MKTGGSLKLRIVVLAAGFSTRLGQPKPLARVRGCSLLRRTLSVTAGLGSGPTIVVIPRATAALQYETRDLNAVLLSNRRRADGLSSSVRRGLAAQGPWSGLLLLPVDLAYLRRGDLVKLIASWRGHSRQVVARRLGLRGGTPLGGIPLGGITLGGTPLILPRWLKADALTIAGDSGLRQLLSRLPQAQLRLMDLPSAVVDVDSPQELAAARRRPISRSFAHPNRTRPWP